MYRHGREAKGLKSISDYFYDNLDNISSNVRNPNYTCENLIDYAKEILDDITTNNISNNKSKNNISPINKGRNNGVTNGQCDECDIKEEECYCGEMEDGYVSCGDDGFIFGNDDSDEEECKLITRDDVPGGISVHSTTPERAVSMVKMHDKWVSWLTKMENDVDGNKIIDIVRNRIWHLYLLVRLLQIGSADMKEKFPKLVNVEAYKLFGPVCEWCNNVDFSETESGRVYEEPYWLRVLSMPTTSSPYGHGELDEYHRQIFLPAYPAYLSCISRTFIMSSLKRICAPTHAYGLMYGLSLFDMTVNVMDLVDSRTTEIEKQAPIGFMRKFNVCDYFDNIFSSIVKEFLIQSKETIINDAAFLNTHVNEVEKTANALNLRHSRFKNPTKISNKAITIATCMISSISRSNMEKDEKIKKRKRTEAQEVDEDNRNRKRHQGLLHKEGSVPSSSSLVSFLTNSAVKAAAEVSPNNKNSTDLKSFSSSSSSPISSSSIMTSMGGAIALTRSHLQKNSISDLVENVILSRQNKEQQTNIRKQNANTIQSIVFDTKFTISGIDVSYISDSRYINPIDQKMIVGARNGAVKNGSVYIDKVIDRNLSYYAVSPKKFTRELLKILNNITKSRSLHLYPGQSVTFTHSNIKPYIFGSKDNFHTKDTGVVDEIIYENGEIGIVISMDRRQGEKIYISPGTQNIGVTNNARVIYLPIESSKTMTIYSCQGQTFWRDTIVDLSFTSIQDKYVAITRNGDIVNLKILHLSDFELKILISLKNSMGRDKLRLYPLGALRNLNDYYVSPLKGARESASIVTACQRFIMERTNNSVVFNSEWMKNTGDMLRVVGLEQELKNIDMFFLSSKMPFNTAVVDNIYKDKSFDVLIELYTSVSRSVLQFCLSREEYITKPSQKTIDEYLLSQKEVENNIGYVKIHPSFLNRPPREKAFKSMFYDIAPHSFITMVFQVYIHYIFMVYEQVHICNASFAFIPGPCPLYNSNIRSSASPTPFSSHTCFKEKSGSNCGINRLLIPDGLEYESDSFKISKDGGIRDQKVILTARDKCFEKLQKIKIK